MIYQRAKYLALRPPHAFKGHTFDCLDPIGEYTGPPLLRCVNCLVIVTDWQVRERYLTPCQGLLAAIPSRPKRKWRRP